MADEKPRLPIRRFDVFAEYNRLKYLDDGMPADQAAGRGIWVAKVVAGRRGGPAVAAKSGDRRDDGKKAREAEKDEKFLSVGGVEQSDRTFEREIVDRMGRDFYAGVFSPAISQAYGDGKRYEEIRDTIRKTWK